MEPVTAVAFSGEYPLPIGLNTSVITIGSQQLQVVNCAKVMSAEMGMWRLTIPLEEMNRTLQLEVPAHAVLWLLQAEPQEMKRFGFAPAT